MIIEVEGNEFDHRRIKGIPFLFSAQPAQNRFQVALVGIFEDERCVRLEDTLDLGERGVKFGQVMNDANHRRTVKKFVDKR